MEAQDCLDTLAEASILIGNIDALRPCCSKRMWYVLVTIMPRTSALTQRLLITGVFRTTNIQAREKEASVPQLDLFLEHKLNIHNQTTNTQSIYDPYTPLEITPHPKRYPPVQAPFMASRHAR